jgi:hypothetical protein
MKMWSNTHAQGSENVVTLSPEASWFCIDRQKFTVANCINTLCVRFPIKKNYVHVFTKEGNGILNVYVEINK